MLTRRAQTAFTGLLFALAIIVGLFFRFHDLGKPVPFEDEAMTWLRVSGRTEAALNGFLFNGKMHTAGEIAGFQRRTPERGAAAVTHTLAVDDPQHAPLYFVLERTVAGITGESIAARRLLSAFSGVGFVVAFAWLCFTLFGTRRATLIGASLAALSPLHIIYSQQAREYELWACVICLWNVTALSAARRNTHMSWLAYACASIVSLYVSLLSLPLLLAHALWIISRQDRRTRVGPFISAAGCALLAYAPWLLNLAANKQSAVDANTWTAGSWPMLAFVAKWAFNLSSVFFDATYANMRYAPLSVCVLLVILYACFEVRGHTSPSNALFILLLGGVSAAVFLAPDLLFGQHRSVTARYVFPLLIAVQLAVTGMLAVSKGSVGTRRVREALCVALLTLGACSAYVRSTRISWWENNKDAALPAFAETLDAHRGNPLLAEDGTIVLDVSNLLDSHVRVCMVDLRKNTACLSAAARRGSFVLTPSGALRTWLAAGGLHLEPVSGGSVEAPLRTFRGELPQEAQAPALYVLR